MSKEEANNIVYTCSEHSMDMYFKVKELPEEKKWSFEERLKKIK